jgi:hypothetical protein
VHPLGPLPVFRALHELEGGQHQSGRRLGIERRLVVSQLQESGDGRIVSGRELGPHRVAPGIGVGPAGGAHEPAPIGLGALRLTADEGPVVRVTRQLSGVGAVGEPGTRDARLGRVETPVAFWRAESVRPFR